MAVQDRDGLDLELGDLIELTDEVTIRVPAGQSAVVTKIDPSGVVHYNLLAGHLAQADAPVRIREKGFDASLRDWARRKETT